MANFSLCGCNPQSWIAPLNLTKVCLFLTLRLLFCVEPSHALPSSGPGVSTPVSVAGQCQCVCADGQVINVANFRASSGCSGISCASVCPPVTSTTTVSSTSSSTSSSTTTTITTVTSSSSSTSSTTTSSSTTTTKPECNNSKVEEGEDCDPPKTVDASSGKICLDDCSWCTISSNLQLKMNKPAEGCGTNTYVVGSMDGPKAYSFTGYAISSEAGKKVPATCKITISQGSNVIKRCEGKASCDFEVSGNLAEGEEFSSQTITATSEDCCFSQNSANIILSPLEAVLDGREGFREDETSDYKLVQIKPECAKTELTLLDATSAPVNTPALNIAGTEMRIDTVPSLPGWRVQKGYWYGWLDPSKRNSPKTENIDSTCLYSIEQSAYNLTLNAKFKDIKIGFKVPILVTPAGESIQAQCTHLIRGTPFDTNDVLNSNIVEPIPGTPTRSRCCSEIKSSVAQTLRFIESKCEYKSNVIGQYEKITLEEEKFHCDQNCGGTPSGSLKIGWNDGGLTDRMCPSWNLIKANMHFMATGTWPTSANAIPAIRICEEFNTSNPVDQATACFTSIARSGQMLVASMEEAVGQVSTRNAGITPYLCWTEYTAKSHIGLMQPQGGVYYECAYPECYQRYDFNAFAPMPPDPCDYIPNEQW